MSNKVFVLDIPEDLLRRAEAVRVDVRRLLIQTLESVIEREEADTDELMQIFARADALPDDMKPTLEEIDQAVDKVRAEMDSLRRATMKTASA